MIAIVSLAVGNFAALVQRDLKRLLAYSSVSHAGFMLIAIAADNELGARALLYYLIPYGAMSIGSFAVVAARERELQAPVTLENLAGLGWERPFLGASLWVFMLGFMGMPFTGGLIGKFYVFAAAYEAGWWWLIVAGVIATAISLYYYLGVIRAIYVRPAAELQPGDRGRLAAARRSAPERGLARGRRHGRLVLLRAAADRPRRQRGRVAALLAAPEGGAQPLARSHGRRGDERLHGEDRQRCDHGGDPDHGRRAFLQERRPDGGPEEDERERDGREHGDAAIVRLRGGAVEDVAEA